MIDCKENLGRKEQGGNKMSYQHLRKPKDMVNEPGVGKRPKCVSFVFWWFIVLGVIIPVSAIASCLGSMMPGTYQAPWTEYAAGCILCVLMLDCARMISKRNMTAVCLSDLTLFFSAWIVTGIAVAIGLALLPMVFLAFPHSIRWLKLNNRFSVFALIASILLVFFIGGLYFMPIVTETVISNANPLSVVLPGDKALREVNECYQHEYWCRQHFQPAGKFVAQYNQSGKCCYVRLDGSDAPFWGNVFDFCAQRFGNRISWSEAVRVNGHATEESVPMSCGTIDKKIIMIFPLGYKDSPHGTLLVCDAQLNSELDFLFALPDENALISHLNDFLENRDWILSVEHDVDEVRRSRRHDIYEGLKELRNQVAILEHLSYVIEPRMVEIKNPKVAKIVEEFELRHKALKELATMIWCTAHNALTAIEYSTKALAMPRHERIQLRRQYLEDGSDSILEEILPIDPKDHSGQNRIFDNLAKQFKEGREAIYWELHRKTGYSLGRPYNPAADQGANEQNKPSKQFKEQPIHNNPISGFYGSKDRQRLFSKDFRNGLGMY